MKANLAMVGLFLAALAAPGLAAGRHQAQLEDGLKNPYSAPEFVGIRAWLNSVPLSLKSLRGKVVLIDFWTYSCINCIRALPHITDWDRKYRDQGLVVIGVHTPEFKFEQNVANIKRDMAKYQIRYPVAVDSGDATWNAYKNESWPAHYLVDQNGKVVYTHFGEGDYDVTENNIRALLGMRHENISPSTVPFSANQTPETYLGSERAERQEASLNSGLPLDHWGLEGGWKIEGERIISTAAGSVLRLHFDAKNVYLVMGTSAGNPASASLKLNGHLLLEGAGRDVHDAVVTVNGHTLYELVDQSSRKPGLLEITANGPGVEMYAFTFGS